MKWLITGIASVVAAVLCVSVPSLVFTTEASANRMNGKPSCGQMNCMQDRYYAAKRKEAKQKKPQ